MTNPQEDNILIIEKNRKKNRKSFSGNGKDPPTYSRSSNVCCLTGRNTCAYIHSKTQEENISVCIHTIKEKSARKIIKQTAGKRNAGFNPTTFLKDKAIDCSVGWIRHPTEFEVSESEKVLPMQVDYHYLEEYSWIVSTAPLASSLSEFLRL